MRGRLALLVFLVSLLASGLSWAADNGDLWLVKSLAMSDRDTGDSLKMRVMVYRTLTKAHGYDKVVVDILELNELSWSLRKSVELRTPGYKGHISDVSLKNVNDERMGIILDIDMRAMEGLVLREIFLISPSGVAKRFIEAESKDPFIPLD